MNTHRCYVNNSYLKAQESIPLPALSTFFFTYFAFIGAVNPYFSLWLQSEGYTASQIGYLLAIPAFMRLFGPTSWGRLADRTGQRVRWLRWMARFSAVGVLILAGAAWSQGSMHWLLAVLGLLVLHAMLSGQIPLAESLLLQKIHPDIKRYGRVRLFGSLGFIVAVALLGPLLDFVGIQYLLLIASAILLCHIVATSYLSDAAPKPISLNATPIKNSYSLWDMAQLPHIAPFLLASFLMVFGHMGLYIYFSLYLEAVGYSKTLIGVLWAISAVGEVVYFWAQPRLKASPVRGYTRTYWVAVARFGLLAWMAIPLGSPLWLLLLLQLTHTVTFAMHHAASMALVKQLFPDSAGSTANALFNTVCYGLAGTLGAIICASIWQRYANNVEQAAQAIFVLSAVACALGGLVAWRLRHSMRVAGLA